MRKRKGNIAILLCVMLVCSTLFSSAAVFAETGIDENKPSTETKIEKAETEATESTTEPTESTTEPTESTTEPTKPVEPLKPMEPLGVSGPVLGGPAPEFPSPEIEKYLTKVNLSTEKGGIYDPTNGSTLNPSDAFTVELTFSEIVNGRQFPADGVMTYQVPTQITGFVPETNKTIMGNLNDVETEVGTYSITTGGLITVQLKENIVKVPDLRVSLAFNGSFDFTETEGKPGESITIEFVDGIEYTVNFDDTPTLEVTKAISTQYNQNTKQIGYSVTVSTDYLAKQVVVKDTMDSRLKLVENSLSVVDSNSTSLSPKYLTAEELGGATWGINVGDMAKDAKYTITYTAELTQDAIDAELNKMQKNNSDPYKFEVNNTVTAKGEESNEDSDHAKAEIQFTKIVKKSCKVMEDGLEWTVTINADKLLDLSGYLVTDTLSQGLTIDTKTPMTIKKDGNPLSPTKPWNELTEGSSLTEWKYKFPEDSDNSQYTFIYKTTKPADGVGSKEYTNNVKLTNENMSFGGSAKYTTSSVNYEKVAFNATKGNRIKATDEIDWKGYDPTAQKVVYDNGETYLRWTHLIYVPSNGLEDVVLTDKTNKLEQNADHKETDRNHILPTDLNVVYGTPNKDGNAKNELIVDGVTESEAPADIINPTDTEFSMKFAKLPAKGTPYVVKVSGYTKVTGEQDGRRRNSGELTVKGYNKTLSDWEDYEVKVNISGEKTGVINPDNTITWTVKFWRNYANLSQTATIKDSFTDNQEFIDGSATITRGKAEVNITPTSLGTDYIFNIGNLEVNTDYVLQYKTKIKDEFLIQPKAVPFTNTAKVFIGDSEKLTLTDTVTLTKKLIKKELLQEPTANNEYMAKFQITVNPEGRVLNSSGSDNPNDYVVVDESSASISVPLDNNINVKRVEKDGTTTDLTQVQKPDKNEYSVGYATNETTKSKKLTITIGKADGFQYIITYGAKVSGAPGKAAQYKNSATLFITNEEKDSSGEVSGSVEIKQSSSGNASGNTVAIYVQKRDANNTLRLLNGAEFKLYKDSETLENLLGTETTNGKGMVTFGQDAVTMENNLSSKGEPYYLKSGQKYILVETQAPKGYEGNVYREEFQIGDVLGDIDQSHKRDETITVTNQKHNFDIQKTDGFGSALEGAEFTLFKDAECAPESGVVAKATESETAKGLFTFKGLDDGTYYLKETQIPKGYVDPQHIYEVKIDQGVATVTLNGKMVQLGGKNEKTLQIQNLLPKSDKGSITVTKQVKTNGVPTASDKTYYTALFLDKELKDLVGDPKPLVMNGKDVTSVTFDDLELGKTYYVAETDKGGTALTSTNNSLGATITYDKQNVELNKASPSGAVTITNSYINLIPPSSLLGSIKVTKDVKQDGVALDTDNTYYVALFNNSNLTNKVGTPKPLEMKGKDSTTVTFDNLPINATYYVAETDANGVPLPNQDNSMGATITYENQVVTLDANHLTADSKITNSYVSEYYWAGSIDVTKRVTISGTDTATDYVFYAGIYTDEGCTQRVGDIQPILMGGNATSTVSFPDLPLGTYYVAETDAEGNVITDAKEQLGCELTINNSKITLTEETSEGSAELVNNYDNANDFYYDGQLTVNKTTTYNGKAYNTNDVYYVALFADKDHSKKMTEVKALEMNGNNTAAVSFTELAYQTYYLAETDENGKALTDVEAAKRGFTSVVNQTVEVGDEPTTIDLENQLTQEYVDNNGGNNSNTGNNATSKTSSSYGNATQTGDTGNMTPVVICMIMALIAMGTIVIKRRKEIKK